MQRHLSASRRRQVFLPALIAAIVAACLAALGVVEPLERQTLDARFRYAQPPTLALTDDIRLVDIDDGAIESVGRWPWKRSVLADAIDELTRAGAKAIAFDLLLDNPSEPEWAQIPGDAAPTRIDHDDALSRALAGANAILAIDAPFELDAMQRAALGPHREIAERMFAHFREDISRPYFRAHGPLVSTDIRIRRVQHLAALTIALERRAAMPPDETDSVESLVRAAAPSVSADTGRFAERSLLERAAAQAHSIAIVASRTDAATPRAIDLPLAIEFSRVSPPTPALARSAPAFGFVNFTPDSDDAVRRMRAVRSVSESMNITQFGLAAAAAFRGERPSSVRVDKDAVRVLDARIPLRDGRMLIAWPSRDAHRARADSQRLSIGVCASLAENRRTYDRLLAQRRTLVAAINDIPEDRLTDRSFAAAAELAALRMEEFREVLESGETLSDAEREYIAPYERFVRVQQAIEAGARDRRSRDRTAPTRLGTPVLHRVERLGRDRRLRAHPHAQRRASTSTPSSPTWPSQDARAAPSWAQPSPRSRWASRRAARRRVPTALSLLGLVALTAGWTIGAGYLAFRHGDVALPIAAPLVSLVSVWGFATALDAASSRAERQRISRQFKRASRRNSSTASPPIRTRSPSTGSSARSPCSSSTSRASPRSRAL